MITEHGWLPRNTVVTLPLSTRFGNPDTGRFYWEVLDWTSGSPVKIGSWGFAEFPFVRVRAHGGPWAYQQVKEIHTRSRS